MHSLEAILGSETLNENAQRMEFYNHHHSNCMYLERSSILHSSFLPQISRVSLKPTKPIHAHYCQTREESTPEESTPKRAKNLLRMLMSRVINTNCIPCALKRKGPLEFLWLFRTVMNIALSNLVPRPIFT